MPALLPTLKLAEKIAGELSGFCERLDIAGSIRRRRDWVNDIDLVVLPKLGQEEALRARCKQNATVIREGPQMMDLRLANKTQLDLWIAHGETGDMFEKTPSNYGSLLLCRTGSVAHNIFLVERAKELDLIWNPHHGVYRADRIIASATEAEILAALNLPWIKPEDRLKDKQSHSTAESAEGKPIEVESGFVEEPF